MKTMEIKESHKKARECYAISRHLKISYSEVSNMNAAERTYMYNIVRCALETDRNPKNVMSANYHTSRAKLFTTESNAGTDVSYKDVKIANVMDETEIEVVFDTLTFRPDYDTNSTFGFSINPEQRVYVKTNDKIEDITRNDLLFIEIFNRMYKVTDSKIIEAYDLGGKYHMLNILKYHPYDGTQSA